MSVIEVPAHGQATAIIAVQAGDIVYVEGMVAESVAFRAGRTVGTVECDSVRNRRLTAQCGSPNDGNGRPQSGVGRRLTVVGTE
jgi:hypothetical protein